MPVTLSVTSVTPLTVKVTGGGGLMFSFYAQEINSSAWQAYLQITEMIHDSLDHYFVLVDPATSQPWYPPDGHYVVFSMGSDSIHRTCYGTAPLGGSWTFGDDGTAFAAGQAQQLRDDSDFLETYKAGIIVPGNSYGPFLAAYHIQQRFNGVTGLELGSLAGSIGQMDDDVNIKLEAYRNDIPRTVDITFDDINNVSHLRFIGNSRTDAEAFLAGYQAGQTVAGGNAVLTTITCEVYGMPVPNVRMRITADEAGEEVLASELVADGNGKAVVPLTASTVWVWRELEGYEFESPIQETYTLDPEIVIA